MNGAGSILVGQSSTYHAFRWAQATGFVGLSPKTQVQYSLGTLFPGVDVNALGNVTLQAHTDSAPTMFAYGSIIDNVSGDPVYFGGK